MPQLKAFTCLIPPNLLFLSLILSPLYSPYDPSAFSHPHQHVAFSSCMRLESLHALLSTCHPFSSSNVPCFFCYAHNSIQNFANMSYSLQNSSSVKWRWFHLTQLLFLFFVRFLTRSPFLFPILDFMCNSIYKWQRAPSSQNFSLSFMCLFTRRISMYIHNNSDICVHTY